MEKNEDELISNYMEDYKQSLLSAVKQHISNNSSARKPGYTKDRSPYETDFNQSLNENVQGIPSFTPDRGKLFKLTKDIKINQQYVNFNIYPYPQVINFQKSSNSRVF